MINKTNSVLKLILLLFASALLSMIIGGCSSQPVRTSKSQVNPTNLEKQLFGKKHKQNKEKADPASKTGKATSEVKQIKEDLTPKLELSQKGLTLNWIENGQLRMSATATEFKGNEITQQGVLLNFSAKLYQNGKLTAEIKAPKAVADTAKRVVVATGGVTMRSLERATTVKAQWIKWYEKQQKVVGDGGVDITSTMGNLKAAAFVADTGLKTLTVKDSTKGLQF